MVGGGDDDDSVYVGTSGIGNGKHRNSCYRNWNGLQNNPNSFVPSVKQFFFVVNPLMKCQIRILIECQYSFHCSFHFINL